MNLQNKHILFAAQYAAPYAGNFIASLIVLEKSLAKNYNVRCTYLFPRKASQQTWIEDFRASRQAYFSGDDNVLIQDHEADEIIQQVKPDLIYTHFEGYDVPMHKAVKRSGRYIRQVWHMHDALKFHHNPLKAAYQVLCFAKHYGLTIFGWGGVIPCAIAVCKDEAKFIRPFRLWKKIEETVIPNGINLSRISPQNNDRHTPVTFLAFGGRNIDKRTDLLVSAATKLVKSGFQLKVIIIGQEHTKADIEKNICGTLPPYIEIVSPRENINEIFNMADCFVSTSIHETFSYAIAEASIYGLPVIQSDIPGTIWNAGNPSTFVFKTENIDDLAQKMTDFINTPQLELMAKCEETAKINSQRYSLDVWAEQVISFFKSIS